MTHDQGSLMDQEDRDRAIGRAFDAADSLTKLCDYYVCPKCRGTNFAPAIQTPGNVVQCEICGHECQWQEAIKV